MNHFIGIGRLTKEPEVVKTKRDEEETTVANYTLAINGWNDTTDFIPCAAFGRTAEFAEKYLHKGTKIAVDGRIQTGTYKDREGNTRNSWKVVVTAQEFAESKKQSPAAADKPDAADEPVDIPDDIESELPFT